MKRKIHFKSDVTLDEIRRTLNQCALHINLDNDGNLKTNPGFIKSIKRHLVEEDPDFKGDDFGEEWKKE